MSYTTSLRTCPLLEFQSGGIRSDLNVPWVWNDGDISPSQIAYVGPLEQGKSWWSMADCRYIDFKNGRRLAIDSITIGIANDLRG